MSNMKTKKRILLQGASTLIVLGVASAAHSQSVSTTDSAVTLAATVDAKTAVDQLNTGGTTATVNDTNVKSGDGTAVTSSSVLIDASSTTANAVNNTSTPSLKDSGAAATSTTAGISVEQDNQANALAQTGSATDGTEVKLTTGDATDSSLTISATLNRAAATGNTASTAISDTDFTTNGTSATLATRQQNTGVTGQATNISMTATVSDTDIKLTSAVTSGSDLTVSGNTDSAVATANSVTQQMALDGTKLTLGTASATANTAPSGSGAGVSDSDATGEALVSSRQTNTFTDVVATNSSSSITLNSGATKGSSLEVSANLQDSTAVGSTAGNTLSLAGTSVGTGAAIVSTQASDSESAVTASTTGSAGIVAVSLAAGATDLGSSASLTDNKLQSRATGGTVTNTLTVSATSVTLQAPDATVAATISNSALTSDTSLSGSVSAGYATLNDQLIAGDVSATTNAASGADAGFAVTSTGNMKNGSSINNDRNAMTAQAQGALATNVTNLVVGGTLSQGTAAGAYVANAAVIANIQELSDGADVTARVDTTSDPAVLSKVGGALDSSSVSTSNNKIQALADGAAATNAMTVSATTLSTAANLTGDPGSSVGTSVSVDSAFAVVNRQDGGNGTIKAELNDPISVRTEIVGNASASSITSTGNVQDAFATSNKATNSLTLSATSLTGDGAVVNAQNSDAQVSSLIGATGATPTVGAAGANAGTVMDFDGTISGSTVAVTGNMVRGSAISNVGNNSLTVSATTLTGDGTTVQAVADSDSTTTNADFSLGNSQTLDANATSNTQVYATFGLDQALDNSVSNSQIAVSNNVQFGEALGNSANNKVQLTALGAGASGTDPTAALNNVQSGSGADIDSKSEMTLYSNIASSGSSIAINGNSNTALAAVNNANNTMAISGTAIDGSTSSAGVNVTAGTTTADYALNNKQTATGLLDSTAKTTAYNIDNADTTTTGILNGSATMSKNSTTAEASANRVANSLAVSATDNGATAAVGNVQTSDATVNAVASSSNYSLALEANSAGTGGTAYAGSGSSLAMEGNTTTALARGNSASNALNYTVGVSYTGISTDPTVTGTTAATAGALILNSQSNTGGVSAAASSVQYSLALNDGTTGSALNSTATMGNNAATAVAYGNSVTNSLTMATYGAGIPSSAIANNQSNSGAVSATATGVAFAMTPTGVASGSAMRNSGNTVTAQAVGNSSVSTIGGGSM